MEKRGRSAGSLAKGFAALGFAINHVAVDANADPTIILYEPDFQLSAQTSSDFGQGRHGRIAVAVFQPAEIRRLHAASLRKLLLRQPLLDPRLDDATRNPNLRESTVSTLSASPPQRFLPWKNIRTCRLQQAVSLSHSAFETPEKTV